MYYKLSVLLLARLLVYLSKSVARFSRSLLPEFANPSFVAVSDEPGVATEYGDSPNQPTKFLPVFTYIRAGTTLVQHFFFRFAYQPTNSN